MSRFDCFDSFLHHLDNLGMFHMDLGLARVRSALETLDLARPPCLSVQVLGTNGKGSTSTFLSAIFRENGLRTGLYTSPHFLSPRERILVDAEQLPDDLWLDAAEAVLRASSDRSEEFRLTYFELLTVMAAWMFRETGCRACVFEAGLGGAHDATSAMAHNMTAYTPIGLDHVAILGPTLTDIARDKALAMRAGVPAVTAPQEPEVMAVLAEAAREIDAPLYVPKGGLMTPCPPANGSLLPTPSPDAATMSDLGVAKAALPRNAEENPTLPPHPAMPGPHQSENLGLALAAYHRLAGIHDLPQDPDALRRAAREAFIPGRFQTIPAGVDHPAVILDGAHNQPGLECLRRALADLNIEPAAVIFACLADKDLGAMLPLVRSLTGGPIIVPGLDAPGRVLPPAELAARIGIQARPVMDMAEAFETVRGSHGPVLVCGSLYLLAEAYALRPDWLRRN